MGRPQARDPVRLDGSIAGRVSCGWPAGPSGRVAQFAKVGTREEWSKAHHASEDSALGNHFKLEKGCKNIFTFPSIFFTHTPNVSILSAFDSFCVCTYICVYARIYILLKLFVSCRHDGPLTVNASVFPKDQAVPHPHMDANEGVRFRRLHSRLLCGLVQLLSMLSR